MARLLGGLKAHRKVEFLTAHGLRSAKTISTARCFYRSSLKA